MKRLSAVKPPVLHAVLPLVLRTSLNISASAAAAKTPYAYSHDFDSIVTAHLQPDFDAPNPQTAVQSSDMYQTACMVADYMSACQITGAQDKINKIFSSKKSFSRFLISYCEDYAGSIRGWLDQKTHSVGKSFEAAVFFTCVMLFKMTDARLLDEYFISMLELLGIDDVETAIREEMIRSLSRTSASSPENIRRARTALSAVTYTFFATTGKEDDVFTHHSDMLMTYLKQLFADEIAADNSLDYVTQSLLKDISSFEPRSITTSAKVYPQDFYIHPSFENNDDPIHRITSAAKSQRIILQAKTGMGKTMFLRMLALCMNRDNSILNSSNPRLQELSSELGVPDDKYVMLIPASMFSFCFSDKRYKKWTQDLVDLFFNCMFKLSAAFDFNANGNPQRYLYLPDNGEKYEVTEALKKRLRQLATTGHLVVLIDSFDEIVSGPMRTAYLNALSKFCEEYCRNPEAGEVGAHVILTSREMSLDTMNALAAALETDYSICTCRIEPLKIDQQRQLIENWNRYYRDRDASSTETMIKDLSDNHFCQTFALNPYMLSVLCAKPGSSYAEITHDFIKSLVYKTRTNYHAREDDRITDVLQSQNLLNILQNIALTTTKNNSPHFSSADLQKQFKKYIQDGEMADDEIDDVISMVHDILVTAVGLIVPADGDDASFQFINDQIRFQLAAKGIRRDLNAHRNRSSIYQDLLPTAKVDSYVGLLIPLMSDLYSNTDSELAEMLICDLALRESSASTDETAAAEEATLLQAMLDLILARYGLNITTYSIAGQSSTGRAARRTQKLLALRIFSSPAFAPTESEKVALRASAAFNYAKQWLNPSLLRLID